MKDINTENVEKYQKLYEKDPKSQVFAPLAEAYRKMGLIKEGVELASEGVRIHPHFAGGRIALGRLYLESENIEGAEIEFRKAVELAPENLLGYQLLAETQLKLKKTKESLKTFKILLFLNPDNLKAKNAVKKLESLTADEYEDELFAMKPLKEAVATWDEFEVILPPNEKASTNVSPERQRPDLEKINELKTKFLDRVLSLADAFLVRQDMDRAIEALNEAEKLIGPHQEIVRRLKIIHHRQFDPNVQPKTSAEWMTKKQPPPSRSKSQQQEKIEFLQDLLHKIKERDK